MNSERNRAKTVGVAVAVSLAAVAAFGAMRSSRSNVPAPTGQAFYTVDDGKTWFAAPSGQYPPFDHGGKQALGAAVWESGGKRFVGFVSRYTPEALKQIADFERKVAAAKSDPGPGPHAAVMASGREVKRPGDAQWVRIDSPQADALMRPHPPAGQSGVVTAISPD